MKETPLSDSTLKAAKKQLLGQLAISSDNGETQCLSMGKSMLTFGRIWSDEENVAAIESVTAGKVLELACRIFMQDKVSSLVFL
jgi:secreted Zn-dependent insulinase-like peptidase